MDKNHDQTAQDERKFLHDVANVLTLSQGKLHLLMGHVKKNPTEISISEISEKLDQLMGIMNRMADLLQARRDQLSK